MKFMNYDDKYQYVLNYCGAEVELAHRANENHETSNGVFYLKALFYQTCFGVFCEKDMKTVSVYNIT